MGLADTISDYVCDYIPKVLSTGATLAEGPLTLLLAPEIGPAAPFVAAAILWVAEHTIGGLAGFICDETGHSEEGRKAKALALQAANIVIKRGANQLADALGAYRVARGDSRGMMREFSAGNMPASILVPRRTAMGEHVALVPLTRGMGTGLQGPQPTYPIITSPAVTGFTPQPIPIPHVGVRITPQKNPWEIVYDRYQGTWNGQPNATYPKVGF